MHLFGALELEIQPGTPDNPAGVKIALLRYTRGEDGRLLLHPSARPSKRSKVRSIPFKTNWTRSVSALSAHS
jgi:hypothetical protein